MYKQADSTTTFRKGAAVITFRENIDCETFRNIAFFLVLPTVNGECSKSCRQKVRFAMFSCYFLRIIRQSIQVLCPVFSHKVFFRGDYYIGFANTFHHKHDVNNISNTDRKKKKKV